MGLCVECLTETEDNIVYDPKVLPKVHYWCCTSCKPTVTIKLAEADVKRRKLFEEEKLKKGKKK